jgi:hypothetical protein
VGERDGGSIAKTTTVTVWWWCTAPTSTSTRPATLNFEKNCYSAGKHSQFKIDLAIADHSDEKPNQ